jgi:hypothetical protein
MVQAVILVSYVQRELSIRKSSNTGDLISSVGFIRSYKLKNRMIFEIFMILPLRSVKFFLGFRNQEKTKATLPNVPMLEVLVL